MNSSGSAKLNRRGFGMRGILVILDKNFEDGSARQEKKGRSQRM